jgi:glycosyltransferase involved in cell wall biosynthesis
VDLLLVLEQTLGNAVHGANLEQALGRAPAFTARVVRLHFEASWRRRWPVLGNWTLDSSVRARRQVRRLVSDRPPDALYVHTAVTAALLLDVMRRIPTVLSTDATPRNLDTVASQYGHRVRGELVEQGKQRFTGSLYRAAEAVVAQSSWAAESLVRDYGVAPARVHVLSQGADVDAFYAGPRAERDGRPLRLLFVGRDFARKGGHVLLDAVRQLPGDVELDVVTGHDAASELRQRSAVPVDVRLHIDLDHGAPEFLQLFHQADAFVLPTLADAAPLVLGEALAAGLPIVSTSVGAVPEMAVDGVTGFAVPPGSTAALITALRRLLDDDAARLAMSARARALALERYDAHTNNRQVLELLRTVSVRSGLQAS